MKKIAIAQAHKNQMPNYLSWLDKRGFEYEILKDGSSVNGDHLCLLLTGGADIGQNIKRDNNEKQWYREAMKLDIPILGICRGLQLINVLRGGTLHEDVTSEPIVHTVDAEKIAGNGIGLESSFHKVNTSSGNTFEANSRHHQGIKTFGKNLEITSKSPDGLIESMIATDHNIFAVQWHPEREEVFNKPCEHFVLEWLKTL